MDRRPRASLDRGAHPASGAGRWTSSATGWASPEALVGSSSDAVAKLCCGPQVIPDTQSSVTAEASSLWVSVALDSPDAR